MSTATMTGRRQAGPDRPAGDQFWDDYQPCAVWPPFDVLADDGRVLNRSELAARYLDGLPAVSHPRWCDPERCEVLERGAVFHHRLVGRVTEPPVPGLSKSGLVVEVHLERFDNMDEGEWVCDSDHREVVVHTLRYDETGLGGGELAELSGAAAGQLGELLTTAWQHMTGTADRAG